MPDSKALLTPLETMALHLRLEDIGKKGDLSGARDAFAALKTELGWLERELNKT